MCRRFGFTGTLWPVSASRADMDGVPCVPTIDDLPGVPDAAFIGVNRRATPGVLRALAAIGTGGAVCYASGFRESAALDTDGAALEGDIIAAAGDMPILGPNCYGIINATTGASIWPSEHGVRRVERGVAILTQSTNIVISMTMQRRGLPVAYVATVGNQAVLDIGALGAALLASPQITALGLYVEGIASAAGFETMAAVARRLGKPIVAMKSGRSDAGRSAALSHTAAIAGSDAAADAFFRRLGIARVDTMATFLETLKLLHVHGVLPDGRISAMSCSGGETALLSDAAAGRSGVRFPPLDPEHRDRVAATLSDLVTVTNPLDYHTFIWADRVRMTETFTAMLSADFDLSLLTLDWVRTDRCSDKDWEPAIAAMEAAAARTGTRSGVLATLPENMQESIADRLIAGGLVPLCGIEEALDAVQASATIARLWRGPDPAPLILAPKDLGDGLLIDEGEAKARLARAGVPVPAGRTVGLDAVGGAAQDFEGPVAVKALGFAHKTEVGAVRLNLDSGAAIRAAVEMSTRLGATRFLVEAMAPPPIVELIVGIRHDPPYGFSLTIGAGGVFAEMLRDSQTLLLPSRRADIADAIGRLRIAPLFAGYRGGPQADLEAALDAIEAVVGFATLSADAPGPGAPSPVTPVHEWELYPLFVFAQGALAVDALLRVARVGEGDRAA